MELRSPLGLAIGDARRRLGLSQEELAFQSGLHRTSISHIERGLKSPTVDTLAKLAHALETTPSDLLASAEQHPKDKGRRR